MRASDGVVDVHRHRHLILSPSKDEVGTIVRSSWFDGLTMRTLPAFVVSIFLLAYTTPLAADEPRIEIHLGQTIFPVPSSWLQTAGDAGTSNITVGSVFLKPPPESLDGKHGVSAKGIDRIVVLLLVDSGHERQLSIEIPLRNAEQYEVAQPDDAAVAFDGIPFDTLRGGPTLNAGKSVTTPLVLVGSVTLPERGMTVVSARIDPTVAADPERLYRISALFDAQGGSFVMMISLTTSRPLRASDLGLVAAVVDIVNLGAPN